MHTRQGVAAPAQPNDNVAPHIQASDPRRIAEMAEPLGKLFAPAEIAALGLAVALAFLRRLEAEAPDHGGDPDFEEKLEAARIDLHVAQQAVRP
jgi:hypothetical protein